MSILAIVVAVIGWPLSLWFFSRRQGTVAIAITGFLAVFFLVDAFMSPTHRGVSLVLALVASATAVRGMKGRAARA
jgi:hypothetical protein